MIARADEVIAVMAMEVEGRLAPACFLTAAGLY
jgi:hypothetical protein